ncbi:MAG TPA: enoyl-CoA hydratase-related protein, partial [Acidimicrobiales bacterium]|nr:enoyl-CoA hydratase-related protein [Acidimicrobiales bacterium]
MGDAIRVEDDGAVRRLVLCRPEAYNTITPQLRDELEDALDRADRDPDVRVVLLSAEGPAFCAGFGLDWSTLAQATREGGERVWDTVADVQMIGRFGETFAKLHEISKPTVAAVQGWCVAGGTDMVLNADLILAGEAARFGYPPARVWGVPEAPWVWVARLGLERAKRYLFTGDELTAADAAAAGMILEMVPDDQLAERAGALAKRIARLPLNQLQMMKWMLNDVARHQYQPDTSRLLGFVFDGVARHTQEGL